VRQTTFADIRFEIGTKKTRERIFLEEMKTFVPSPRVGLVVR
jgi:hypothetical protein